MRTRKQSRMMAEDDAGDPSEDRHTASDSYKLFGRYMHANQDHIVAHCAHLVPKYAHDGDTLSLAQDIVRLPPPPPPPPHHHSDYFANADELLACGSLRKFMKRLILGSSGPSILLVECGILYVVRELLQKNRDLERYASDLGNVAPEVEYVREKVLLPFVRGELVVNPPLRANQTTNRKKGTYNVSKLHDLCALIQDQLSGRQLHRVDDGSDDDDVELLSAETPTVPTVKMRRRSEMLRRSETNRSDVAIRDWLRMPEKSDDDWQGVVLEPHISAETVGDFTDHPQNIRLRRLKFLYAFDRFKLTHSLRYKHDWDLRLTGISSAHLNRAFHRSLKPILADIACYPETLHRMRIIVSRAALDRSINLLLHLTSTTTRRKIGCERMRTTRRRHGHRSVIKKSA